MIDTTDSYETPLKPSDEREYQQWRMAIGMTRDNGFNMSDDGTGNDYDLRGFFKKYGPVAHTQGQHFTDEFKKPNHQTFSDQSKYSKGNTQGGSWKGDTFVPSSWNLGVQMVNKTFKQGQ